MPSTTSIRRRPRRRILLAGAAAAALAASLTGAATAGAAVAGPVVTATYVNVQGNEAPTGQSITLPPGKAFASNFEQPQLRHFGPGSYGIQVNKLGNPSEGGEASGLVHARVVGATGTCMSDDLANLNGPNGDTVLFIGVECFDDQGHPADRPFTASYTRGGTQSGKLVTARLDPDTQFPTGVVTPRFQESSVGGTVTVTETGPAAYKFNLPALTGSQPGTLAVSPMGGLHGEASRATCSITGTSMVSGGTIKQVKVSCRQPADGAGSAGEPADTGVAVTYAKGINLLGLRPGLSTAYLSMPKTTAPLTMLTHDQAVNQIFGQTDGTTVVRRTRIGTYQVNLQHQEGGGPPDTAIVTGVGANAACHPHAAVTIPGNDERTMLVTCRTIAGQPVDSAFNLQYTAHE
jgi:hypothetical protein